MRALQLDYQRHPRPRPWFGLGLLAAALLALALGWQQARALQGQTAFWAQELARLERLQRGGAPAQPALPEAAARAQLAQVAQANQVLRQLSLPWPALFRAVDRAGSPQVALLALDPDPRAGTVRISGEAKDLPALLHYLRRLPAQQAFGTVTLQSHQIRQDDPQQPVRFVLLAHWKEAAP